MALESLRDQRAKYVRVENTCVAATPDATMATRTLLNLRLHQVKSP
jgi:hypothetical protein